MNLSKFSFLLIAVLMATAVVSHGQKKPMKFGDIDIKDLEMEVYSLDSSAGAVILADYGLTTLNTQGAISFSRHTRIKILNSTEFDRADIKIPHYRTDMVTGLKAATYNLENGKIVKTEINKKADVIKVKSSSNIYETTFGMKNVKEGSIIEFKYEVGYGSLIRIMPWYFQDLIPVVYSRYDVVLPEAYNYKPIMTGYIPLEQSTVGSKNMFLYNTSIVARELRYVAKNVPAFKVEPNITSKQDYISKISFQLHSINIPGYMNEVFMQNSYEDLSREMAKSELYSDDINRTRFLKETVAEITRDASTDKEKAEALYAWMQENFVKGSNDMSAWPKIFAAREASSFEINFLLIMMMRQAGLQAEPVRISTRANGMVHPYFPSSYNFNYLLCLASVDGEEYLLDASDDYLDFNMLSKKCLNGNGLVISEENPRWVELKSSKSSKKAITSSVSIDAEGNAVGKVTISRTGLSAVQFRRSNMEDPETYQKEMAEGLNTWTINAHAIDEIDQIDKPLVENIEMEVSDYAEGMGDIIYVNPILMGGIDQNPYKLENREYPVDYASPFTHVISHSIEIPDGYIVDEIPQALALRLPSNGGAFVFSATQLGNKISVTYQFKINKSMFLQNEYPYLKAFYDQVVDKSQEQIVLKKSI